MPKFSPTRDAAFMLVLGGWPHGEDAAPAETRARYAGYGPAVWKLAGACGSYYIIRGFPIAVLGGAWPEGRVCVVSHWPTPQHATGFWFSPAYQHEVKPLRTGEGGPVFDVAVVRAAPPFFHRDGVWKDETGAPHPSCADHVYVLTTGRVTKAAAYKRWLDLLFASGVLEKTGGLEIINHTGPALAVLEGEWPSESPAHLLRFPCLAAAQACFDDPIYRERLAPLLAEAGELSSAVFKHDPQDEAPEAVREAPQTMRGA
jgi:uncharacterized protein (DUF1330 family)